MSLAKQARNGHKNMDNEFCIKPDGSVEILISADGLPSAVVRIIRIADATKDSILV